MMRETFVNLLDQYPGLRPFLVKIRERYHKRGKLTGTLKLGQGLDPQELSALHSLFGMQAISVSRSDAVSLSFDRFFRGMAPEEREAWIDGVHGCLNIHRTDALQEKRVEQEDFKRLLERLQLAYPKLHGVHQVLLQQLSENRSFTQDLQDLYFKAAEITSFLLQNKDLARELRCTLESGWLEQEGWQYT
ncbi:MAG: hypothetical protein GY852_00590 [bacterium]|nr:hypothetical protein [bacterium]